MSDRPPQDVPAAQWRMTTTRPPVPGRGEMARDDYLCNKHGFAIRGRRPPPPGGQVVGWNSPTLIVEVRENDFNQAMQSLGQANRAVPDGHVRLPDGRDVRVSPLGMGILKAMADGDLSCQSWLRPDDEQEAKR